MDLRGPHRAGIEPRPVRWRGEEGPLLLAAESPVRPDELLERHDLLGRGVDVPDDDQVATGVEARDPTQAVGRQRATIGERVVALDPALVEEGRPGVSDRNEAAVRADDNDV